MAYHFHKFLRRIHAFFKLVRGKNLIILLLTQTIVRIFIIGPKKFVETDVQFSLIAFGCLLIAASGYIINDYYDVKIDIVNKPRRVVIDRFLKRRTALFIHFTLVIFGVVLGLVVGWKIAVINVFSAFLLWLYSNILKRLPLIGNLIVSFLTAFSIFILAIFYGDPKNLILIFSFFSFFLSLIREIIKDIEDLRGDTTFGCKTLPIVWGVRKTKFFLYLQFVILTFLLFTLGSHLNITVLIYFALFVFLPLLRMFYKLHNADTIKEYRSLSAICKYIMISGVISMVFI